MPFIELIEPDHLSRTPGRRVGYGTTWLCDYCSSVYRWDECDGHEVNGKITFHDGHWVFIESSPVAENPVFL